MALGERK